jgi:hypothetical protein
MPPNGIKRHDEKAGHVVGKSRSNAISHRGSGSDLEMVMLAGSARLYSDVARCHVLVVPTAGSALSVNRKVEVLPGGDLNSDIFTL